MQIFTDNAELCRKVSESELSLIFHIACTGDNHAELFTTLQAMTKVNVAIYEVLFNQLGIYLLFGDTGL